LMLLGAVYAAIGTFTSSLTDNQIIAFIAAALLSFVFYEGFDALAQLISAEGMEDFVSYLGIKGHYASISRGVVDFRDLVKTLAAHFRTRIELRQIGVRDEARMVGGYGTCGRSLCCSSFLEDFAPISVKNAKEQGLSLNPQKISGSCGRLLCCLKYEEQSYEELNSKMPGYGAIVTPKEGHLKGKEGTVENMYIIRGLVKVNFGVMGETHILSVNDINIIKKGKMSFADANKEEEKDLKNLE